MHFAAHSALELASRRRFAIAQIRFLLHAEWPRALAESALAGELCEILTFLFCFLLVMTDVCVATTDHYGDFFPSIEYHTMQRNSYHFYNFLWRRLCLFITSTGKGLPVLVTIMCYSWAPVCCVRACGRSDLH